MSRYVRFPFCACTKPMPLSQKLRLGRGRCRPGVKPWLCGGFRLVGLRGGPGGGGHVLRGRCRIAAGARGAVRQCAPGPAPMATAAPERVGHSAARRGRQRAAAAEPRLGRRRGRPALVRTVVSWSTVDLSSVVDFLNGLAPGHGLGQSPAVCSVTTTCNTPIPIAIGKKKCLRMLHCSSSAFDLLDLVIAGVHMTEHCCAFRCSNC